MKQSVSRCFVLLASLAACSSDGPGMLDAGTASDAETSVDAGALADADPAVDSGPGDAGMVTGDGGPPEAVCNDGRRDPGEACDGEDLGGLTCADLGLEGTLRCTAECTLDQMGCSSPSCGSGLRECAGECVDLASSPEHCGACGNTCGAGALCMDGSCGCTAPGELHCDGECVAPSADHCGACGLRCGAGNECVESDGTHSCTELEFRIEEGRLEAGIDGNWRGVCDDGFTMDAATVACRSLGLEYADHSVGQNGPGASFWVDDLNCDGTESSLAECPRSRLGESDCDADQWVSLDCYSPTEEPNTVRIRGGLLEYRYRGTWRGVCDDGFDELDGQVACRELGLVYVSHTSTQPGPHRDHWFDELACTGSEVSIADCPGNTIGVEDCGSSDWVALACREPALTPSVRIQDGLLEYQHMGEWRGVCDDNFDADDGWVACREFGLEYHSHRSSLRGPDADYWLDDLACDGSETNLAECPARPLGEHNCNTHDWIGLRCTDSGTTGNLRIRDGLLEFQHRDEWRGVCDDGFGEAEARVACRHMGLNYVSHSARADGPSEAFWLDELDCNGLESSILDCLTRNYGEENCGSSEWVSLRCVDEPDLRLNEDNLLEFFNAGEWRGVCDDSFDAADGEVACRELGGTYVRHERGHTGPHADFWVDEVACDGSEDFLRECAANAREDENCSASEWVRLVCSGL